ncbi:uncharacterized protein [Physcomitrium patens]|uniref:uncharacterized protein isoform X2 n=1 Tax=Physcomitrium patens TaxID=3218 RepID=UPI000D17DB58|nr:uncharacterized protein LOC112277968 isoform X2 [Physcomitrium patens]|eukprot:XP_024366664.1 uncharacterized protein LOC112277968 isoform X2 [Physcomitrella patens]
MLSTRGRAWSQLLRVAASCSNASSPFANRDLPWLQQRAGISITGDGADSHDDFKPVHKGDAGVSVQEHIERDVKENPVLIYMKGVPDAPQCGFSAMVVHILDEYGVRYKTRNVLSDPELRNAIKEYSNWPTIPQVYVNGEFVGGSDILISMHRSGELKTLLKDVKNIR